MAEEHAADIPIEEPEAPIEQPNQEPIGIPSVVLLSRFLHTGTVTNTIPLKSLPINVAVIERQLKCVIDMAQIRSMMPIATIEKAYTKKLYLKVDFVLIALAYCARQNQVLELKTNAYAAALRLIEDQGDFLIFVQYLRKVQLLLAGLDLTSNRHLGYGAGMRRMIKRWYAKHSTLELANMFGEHRCMGNLTHKSVISHGHMRIDAIEPAVQPDAGDQPPNPDEEGAVGGVASMALTEIPSTSGNVSRKKKQTTDESSSGERPNKRKSPEPPPPSEEELRDQRDRKDVFVFIFMSKDYLKYLDRKPELGPGAERMKYLQEYKTTECSDRAIYLIEQFGFTVDQTPAPLLERSIIWNVLLPSLSLKQLIKYFHRIRDRGLFNDVEDDFSLNFIRHCHLKVGQFATSMICPISLFITKRLYEKNQRYLGTTKIKRYESKCIRRPIKHNPFIQMELESLFERALNSMPPTRANYFITLDLRTNNKKKTVLRNRFINCHEASVLLAYSIYQREKNVSLFTFGAERHSPLEPLPLPKDNFHNALEVCNSLTLRRTFESLAKPIIHAIKNKIVVDVFVVIVDSVARFCRQGQVPQEEFAEYKATINSRAKYLVVNLTRCHDLIIPNNADMTGFFEICGFTTDIPKVLYALGDHRFS